MRTIASIALLVAACAAKAPPASTGPSAPSTGGSTTTSPPAADCVCTMDYAPVCGVDGKTYSNACQAGCAKVAVKANGACK